jgi:hypothetical protein
MGYDSTNHHSSDGRTSEATLIHPDHIPRLPPNISHDIPVTSTIYRWLLLLKNQTTQKKTWNPWYVHEIPIISPWYHHFSWLYPSSPTIIHISPGAHHLTAQKTSLQPCTCRWRSTPCRHGSNRNLGHHLGGSRNWGTSKALNHQLQNDGFSMKQSIQLIIGVPVKWKPLI